MAAEQTEAIVLRTHPWSETSLVVSLYTREFGKLSLVAKGARRPKSPFEAALDLLSLCRVVFIGKSSDSLDILTEAKLSRRFRAGADDLQRLYCGYYLAELLEKMTDRGERHAEVFDLALATINALHEPGLEVRAIALRLELQLLRLTGHQPLWRQCAQCGREDDSEQQRELVFGALAGGILCSTCRIGGRHLIRLSRSVRDTLEYFGQANWQSIALDRYPAEGCAVIRSVLERYLTVLLDRKLLLHNYLQEFRR